MSLLYDPLLVSPPALDNDDPVEFLTQDWLNDTMTMVQKYCDNKDTYRQRVPPLGLIRCSRGGKTRALIEIAKRIKETTTDTACIFVSFNHNSRIKDYEKKDLVTALCKRIAFASLKIEPLYF
jgi:hypothetical protein